MDVVDEFMRRLTNGEWPLFEDPAHQIIFLICAGLLVFCVGYAIRRANRATHRHPFRPWRWLWQALSQGRLAQANSDQKDWEARALSRMQRKGSKPDMAFSAGRDAANQVALAREVYVPMLPISEPEMREFYLGLLGMTEMHAPNYPAGQDGFWAIMGRRRVYFGIHPSFDADPNDLPTLAVPSLDAMAVQLTEAGHQVVWDTRLSYARRLGVVDPAGNTIALIGG